MRKRKVYRCAINEICNLATEEEIWLAIFVVNYFSIMPSQTMSRTQSFVECFFSCKARCKGCNGLARFG